MSTYPVGKICASARKTDHFPTRHIFVSAMDRIGQIALLGVLQQKAEEGCA
jgi:hypothetical protein